jgi:hypothetical protein
MYHVCHPELDQEIGWELALATKWVFSFSTLPLEADIATDLKVVCSVGCVSDYIAM